jgi:sugar phosphate isomerase/epimerase
VKLSCAAYSYRDYLQRGDMSLDGFIDTCADLGLDGIELTAYYFKDTDPSTLASLKRHAFRAGLDLCATAVGGSFALSDEDARKQHVTMVKQWLDISQRLGSPCLRVFAGPTPEGVHEHTARGWVEAGLTECADHAASCGVMIALENHGGLTSTAAQTIRILRDVDHPWLGLNLDIGNFKQDPYREIEDCAPDAITTHAKVSSNGPDGRFNVDYRRVKQILDGAGYRGYLSIKFEEPVDARSGVPAFGKVLREAIG